QRILAIKICDKSGKCTHGWFIINESQCSECPRCFVHAQLPTYGFRQGWRGQSTERDQLLSIVEGFWRDELCKAFLDFFPDLQSHLHCGFETLRSKKCCCRPLFSQKLACQTAGIGTLGASGQDDYLMPPGVFVMVD